MNVLVTGGAGYIGSHTVLRLLEKGHNVVVVDNFRNSSRIALERVEEITNKRITILELDVLNQSEMASAISLYKIKAIIHFAGLKSVSESIVKPFEYYTNNVSGTLSVLEAAKDNNVKKFIFSSSATVYGRPQKVPLDEDSAIGGTTNPYGLTKYIVERMLSELPKAKTGLDIITLRYFNPIGAHPSGMIGEDPNDIPNNLLPYLTQVASGKLNCLKVFGNDYETHDGTGVRDYVHVMDLAEGHIAALQSELEPDSYRVYNLGTGKGYSVLNIIDTFEKVTGVNINVEFAARRDGDIAECWSNPTLANNELNWKCRYDLSEMLEHAWNWQLKNPEGYKD